MPLPEFYNEKMSYGDFRKKNEEHFGSPKDMNFEKVKKEIDEIFNDLKSDFKNNEKAKTYVINYWEMLRDTDIKGSSVIKDKDVKFFYTQEANYLITKIDNISHLTRKNEEIRYKMYKYFDSLLPSIGWNNDNSVISTKVMDNILNSNS